MRLIDVNEAREQMLKLLDHHLVMKNYAADDATQDCIEVLNEMPIIDAQPIVHGYWIEELPACNGDIIIRCSSCNRVMIVGKQIGTVDNYCPNCGAKMDEVSE